MDRCARAKVRFAIGAPLLILLLLLLPPHAAAQTYSVIHDFHTSSARPNGPLLQGIDGSFYGTTVYGGTSGHGMVFRMDSSGNVTKLHSFNGADGANPNAGLIQAMDENFYGMTSAGGTSDAGTVFRMDPSGNVTTLHSFAGPEGSLPVGTLVQGTDGNLYGIAANGGASGLGTVFKMSTSGALTTLHHFSGSDGSIPYAGLIQGADGNFYGTTQIGGANDLGTVFKMDSSGDLTTLHSFAGADGANPLAGLIQATDGDFYGSTFGGGADTFGTVFKINSSGILTTLHSFSRADGAGASAPLYQASDGGYLGTTYYGGANDYGTVFKMDSSGTLTTLHSFTGTDGANPLAGLIEADDGNFYGTTFAGNADLLGTIFRMDGSGNVTTLSRFLLGSDGSSPSAALVQATDGNFYGTTQGGGAYNLGSVFMIDSQGDLTSLHSFTANDGSGPFAGLIQATDGTFYGTTHGGGAQDRGTVFKMDSSGNLTTLHSFTESDGSYPLAGLIEGNDGEFYGTTSYGGVVNCDSPITSCGTVFKIDSSGNMMTLHSFTGSDGYSPQANLIQATDGNFYGSTAYGGTGGCGTIGCGTIFRMDSSGNLTTLHSFTRSDGSCPRGLIQAADGNFYGTTFQGGAGNCPGGGGCGTVFKIDSSGNLTTLHSFSGSDGSYPLEASLRQTIDGNFIGTTYRGGESDFGTAFMVDSLGGLTTLHSFSGSDGSYPLAGLIQATDGDFYGTAAEGGAGGGGVAFRFELCSPAVASSNGPVCSGQTLQLAAYPSSGANYSWTGPNGFVSTLQAPAISNATAADSGTYTVTVTSGTCSPAHATVDVAVNPGPPPAPVITPPTGCVPANTPGLTASVPANAGNTYAWTIAGGTITGGQGTSAITFTSGEAGTVIRLGVTESNTSCSGSDIRNVQVDFADMPASNPFHDFVCAIARNGITVGCGGGNFCPLGSHLREQMAVFIMRASHGPTYVPPAATGTMFTDVAADSFGAAFIEEAAREGIMGVGEDPACGANQFCPADVVTRLSMAYILLRGQHGASYLPPAADCGNFPFGDVTCPSLDADFVAQLHAEGITAGCDTTHYCPDGPVVRAQMAVFLTVTFALP